MDSTVLLFLILKLKMAALMKAITINVYIVFFGVVIILLSFFNFKLFLGLNYDFIGFFSYYNILVIYNIFLIT